MMSRALRGVVAALALCTLFACDDSDTIDSQDPPNTPNQPNTPTPDPRAHPSTGESWTFLVYMVADNNLEAAALDDLIEMAAVGSTTKLNIVVQIDRAEGYTADGLTGLPDFTSTKRLRVMNNSLEVLSDLGELNMGDPQVLSDFITWGVKAYPADRYALIFWDHGGAWPGFGGDNSTQNDDLLTLAELKSGIKAGMTGASLNQFSLIGYDACLMATYEVALAMKPFGEYLLASEELEPGHGWDYRNLSVLKQNPALDPLTFGKSLIDGFKAQAVASNTSADITLSLTDLYALVDLEVAVNQLAAAYPTTSASAATATAFGRGRTSALKFGEFPNPAQSTNMVDLGDLADQVAAQLSSASAAQAAVNAALAKAVLYKTSGSKTSRAKGLSIYFPPTRTYYDSAYGQLTEVGTWREFLTRFLQGGSVTVAPAFTSSTAAAQKTSAEIAFTGTLVSGAAANITTAELYYGYASSAGDKLYILGDRTAQVGSSTVVSSWNYKALKLTQGALSGYAYLSLTAESGGQVSVTMPFAYYESAGAEAQFAVRQLMLDSAGNVTQDTYYVESSGGFGELFPVPGAVLQPLVQVYDTTTDTSYFDVLSAGSADFDATQPIGLGFERLASGTTVFGILSIEDYSGAGDQASSVEVIP